MKIGDLIIRCPSYHITNPPPPQTPAGYLIQQIEKVGDKWGNHNNNSENIINLKK